MNEIENMTIQELYDRADKLKLEMQKTVKELQKRNQRAQIIIFYARPNRKIIDKAETHITIIGDNQLPYLLAVTSMQAEDLMFLLDKTLLEIKLIQEKN